MSENIITLFCAFAGVDTAPFYIEIDKDEFAAKMNTVIKAKNADIILGSERNLQLFVATKFSGQWMDHEEAKSVAIDSDGHLNGLKAVNPMIKVKNAIPFYESPELGERQIHLLVVLPPGDLKRLREGGNKLTHSEMACIQNLLTNCDLSGDLPQPAEFADLFEWDDSDCGKVKDMEAVGNIMEFARPKFYVRKEILCVLENFNKFLQQKDASANSKQQFIFVGSPGTGKSCILALICFYLATVKKVPVVLHRCVNTGGDTLATTRFFYDGKYYEWIDVDGEVYKSVRLNGRTIFPDCWYCLDGLDQKQLSARNWSNLYTLLATSGQFEKMGEGGSKQVNCLVPYWRRDDLQRIAAEFPSPDERDVATRYFVSGGNVRDFFLPASDANDLADAALRQVTAGNADLLLTTYGCSSNEQIDRIRMMGVTDTTNAEQYIRSCFWRPCVTSMKALQQLASLMTPEYFQKLAKIAKGMNDDRLRGTALEHFFHSLVRNQRCVHISYVTYDNVDRSKQTSYEALMLEETGTVTFGRSSESNVPLRVKQEGATIKDQVEVMKRWAADPDEMDYWIPASSTCETIDAVAKWKTCGALDDEPKEQFCLLQLTKATKHKCSADVLWQFADPFFKKNHRVCYMTLLFSDDHDLGESAEDKILKFRLDPVMIDNGDTEYGYISLYVAAYY